MDFILKNKKCNNCHAPAKIDLKLGNTFACSKECEQDLDDMLDGVSFDEIMARGRTTDCSCVNWCQYCKDKQ